MKAEKKAERALFERIAQRAKLAEVDDLVKLAEAFKHIKWGAQGRTDQIYDQRVRRETPLEKGTGFR